MRSSPSLAPPRQGVILLVVVLMLALFMVVGLTFVYYAESSASAARNYREAQTPDVADQPPEQLLSYGLGQLIYPVPDDASGVQSALRGIELARLAYGWNYTTLPGSLQIDPNMTNNITTNPFQANVTPFNGMGPLRGLPVLFNGVNEYDMINYTWYASDNFLRDPEHPAAPPGTPNSTMRTNPNQPLPPYAGGFNPPYTYPDRANLPLAAVQADDQSQNHLPRLLAQSFFRPTATLPFRNSQKPNAPQIDPTVIPGGQNFWNLKLGDPGYSPAWKYLVLRPRPGDQLLPGETLFQDPADGSWKAQGPNGIRFAFPPPLDAGGDLKQLPNVPFYIKDANPQANPSLIQVKNDSFWMDLGYPVQLTRNGKKYKPLFAFLVLPLDGKLNLNVHGNMLAGLGTANSPYAHASDQGLARHEVNITKVLNFDQTANAPPMEWQQLFTGLANNPAYLGRYGMDKRPGMAAPAPQNQYPDPYAMELAQPVIQPDLHRSLIYPFDFDAADPTVNTKPVTTRFALPFMATVTTNPRDFRSFPNYPAAYDNYTFVATQPTTNPRLYHPLLSQKLRYFGDDMVFGLDNMYNLLSGNYQKSYLYGLIPQNLDWSTPPTQPSLGPKVRELISVYSADLDAPAAPPWVTDPTTNPYVLTAPTFTPPPTLQGPIYPVGQTPYRTPAYNQLTAQSPNGDFKPGDGRANLLSRADLSRHLTSYRDPTTGQVTPLQAQKAILDRQQFAKDIFDRLVRATGALKPPPLPPGVAGPGTLTQANGATAQHYAATRWLAQLAVNIVDYVDEDDFITPFQWNPLPDPAIASADQFSTPDNGWVYGTEAPQVVINEAYCELQNDPQDHNASQGATHPYQYSFWLELYNAMPADPTAPADPPASRLDPDKYNTNHFLVAPPGQPVLHDRMAAQLEGRSQTLPPPVVYPIYQVAIVDESHQDIAGLLARPQNTAGWFTDSVAMQDVKIQMIGFKSRGTPHSPTPQDGGDPNYFDANFVEPSTGGFSTTQPLALPKNQGFCVLAPDANHGFQFGPEDGTAADNLDPTLRMNPPAKTPERATTFPPPANTPLWGQAPNGTAQNGLTYTTEAIAPADNTTAFRDRKHTVVLRRLACPYIDPNPINPATGLPYDVTKPFNPYVTVDYMNHVKTYDAVQWVASGPSNQGQSKRNPRPPQGGRTLANERYTSGRQQPYAATVPAPPAQGTAQPIHHSFFKHNDANAAPFDWYVHLDRAPTTVMEVLNVSAFPPHLLTQKFIVGTTDGNTGTTTPSKYQHLAPWAVQNARIFRALEFFTVGDRNPYPGTLGRVVGKIDLNAVFDKEIVDAMMDGKPFVPPPNPLGTGNFFTQQALTDVWQYNSTLADPKNYSFQRRKEQLLTLPGANQPDKPFMSLAAPVIGTNPPDTQYPTGAGIADTYLPFPVTVGQNTTLTGTFLPRTDTQPPTPPSLNYTQTVATPPRLGDVNPPNVMNDLLTKVAGHATTRSNTFAVFMTVGFFEVIDDTTMPVKLGGELTTATGKVTRHQMFAVVDRTNLAFDPNNGPTGRLLQAPTPPVLMSVVNGVRPTDLDNQGRATVTIAGGIPIDYDGTSPAVLKAGQTLYYGSGLTQEAVMVTAVGQTTGLLTLKFPNNTTVGHSPSELLSTYPLGNPGPQGLIDYNSPQYRAVVPYTYIVQ
jgi:hypothetical protein